MVSGKLIKLLVYEILEFAAFSIPILVVAEQFASAFQGIKNSAEKTFYWFVVSISIAYVALVTLIVWIPVKVLFYKKHHICSKVKQWCQMQHCMRDKASEFGMVSESMIRSSESGSTSLISEACFNTTEKKKLLPEDLYCETLGKILHHVKTPVTVGLYGPCRHRLSRFMERIKNHMLVEAEQSEENPSSQCLIQFYHQILLLWKIAMCVPEIPTGKTKTHYIFVPFQAWEFAGSDFLWAGLVTTLCDFIEEKYWVPLIFYKLFGIPVQDPSDAGRKQMKRWLKRTFFLILVNILFVIGLCSYILDLDTSDTMKGLLIPGAIISMMTLWNFVRGIYAFFQNSKESINRLMNSSKVSNQLGFMHSVKEKVQVLTKFLCVLGAYKKQQIKVVLQISHLDACPPEKVMGALEALRILHSDPEAPFISILAADSKVVAESVERSRNVGSLTGSGYQYLSQFITLPFSVPHMNKEAKKNLLDEIKHSEKTDKQNYQIKKRRWQSGNHNGDFEDGGNDNRDLASVTDQFQTIKTHLKEEKIAKFLPNNQAHMERVLYTSWITLNLREQKFNDKLRLAQQQTLSMEEEVCLIKEGEKQQLQKTNWEPNGERWDQNREVPREVIAWVLLANEWPCRVSWMLQCAQDDQQWREIREHSKGQNDPQLSGTMQQLTVGTQKNLTKDNTNRPYVPEAHNSIKLEDSLEMAFVKAVAELDSIKEEVTKLMELDGDPEIFLKMLFFLDKEFRFTVQKALDYWDITTNLDGSLKRHMELIRGSRTLKQAASCQRFLPLSLLKMSTEDVCQVLEQNARALGISDTNMKQYIEKIRKENLSGRALVYSLNSEIRQTLGMTLGDWASFSISFLNVLPETNSTLAATLRM